MGSVVKHSYIKGRNLEGRARAHLDYIQYRPGDDKEPGKGQAREFQTPEGDGKGARQFREAFSRENSRNYVVHKFIVSPGRNGVNMDKFTKEVMSELGAAKGQDLRYGWVVHGNTDHVHSHVIVLGKDEAGKQVRFTKLDHLRMRAFGDRYLEREHGIERYLDADMERYARSHGLNIMYERERGDEFYKLLSEGHKDKGAKKAPGELDWLDEQWDKFLQPVDWEPQEKLGQSHFHHVGLLTEWHLLAQNIDQQKIWEEVRDGNPELKDLAEQKLGELAEQKQGIFEELAERTGIQDPLALLDKLAQVLQLEAKELSELLGPSNYDPQELEPEAKQSELDKELDRDPGRDGLPDFDAQEPDKPISIDDLKAQDNAVLGALLSEQQLNSKNPELQEIDSVGQIANSSLENIFAPTSRDEHDLEDFAHELLNGSDLEDIDPLGSYDDSADIAEISERGTEDTTQSDAAREEKEERKDEEDRGRE